MSDVAKRVEPVPAGFFRFDDSGYAVRLRDVVAYWRTHYSNGNTSAHIHVGARDVEVSMPTERWHRFLDALCEASS